jgi:hypothetical protein
MPISFQNPTNLVLPPPLRRAEVQVGFSSIILQSAILVFMDPWPARILGSMALVGVISALLFLAFRKG